MEHEAHPRANDSTRSVTHPASSSCSSSSLGSSGRSAEARLLQETVRARLQGKKHTVLANEPLTTSTTGIYEKLAVKAGSGALLRQAAGWQLYLSSRFRKQLMVSRHLLMSIGSLSLQLIKLVAKQLGALWRHRYMRAVRWRVYRSFCDIAQLLLRQLKRLGIFLRQVIVRALGPELTQAFTQLFTSIFGLVAALVLLARCLVQQWIYPALHHCMLFLQRCYRYLQKRTTERNAVREHTTSVPRASVRCATWSPGKETTPINRMVVEHYKLVEASSCHWPEYNDDDSGDTGGGGGLRTLHATVPSDSRPRASAPSWSAVADQVQGGTTTSAEASLRPHSLPRRFKRRKERAILQLIDLDDTSL